MGLYFSDASIASIMMGTVIFVTTIENPVATKPMSISGVMPPEAENSTVLVASVRLGVTTAIPIIPLHRNKTVN